MATSARAFVLRHTTLRPLNGIDGIRLHQAGEVLSLWHAVQVEAADPDAPMPFWAFAWGGGLAIARYLAQHPEVVAGRRVFDLGSGSGLCAIAACRAGAATVTAADIDRFSIAAIELNARANHCRVVTVGRDVLGDEAPEADIVLAGDTWYEAGLAARVLPWLERAQAAGAEVLIGDPGRRYLPAGALHELATYQVRTTTELEDLELKRASVYALRA
jgi:predicted nicotinamide N-methyase